MRFALILFFSLSTFCGILKAQVPVGQMVGHWSSDDLSTAVSTLYNEVWGFVHQGEEYAAIGSYKGIHIIQLDNANGPTEVAFVAGAAPNVVHREVQSYENFLYAVAQEGNSSLQVIDFSNLPESVEVVFETDEWFSVTENIFIDKENARLYTSDSPVPGIQNLILSLENPAEPTELGAISAYGGGHGLNVQNNIAVLNRGFIGLSVIDCTSAQNPDFINGLTGYPEQGYAHSGWLTDDGSHYIMLEDLFTDLIKMISLEDLTDIKVVDVFKSDSDNPSTAYDVMITGDLAYIAYNGDGLWVYNISNPDNVIPAYRFDTVLGAGFPRVRAVYSQLPSERILVSDSKTGLYLISPPAINTSVLLSEFDGEQCLYQDTLIIGASIGADFDPSTFNYQIELVPAIADVEIIGTPEPGNTFSIQLSNFNAYTSSKVTLTGGDSNISSIDEFYFIPISPPEGITLSFPENSSTSSQSANQFFSWEDLSLLEADEYEIQVSLNEAFSQIFFSVETTDNFASIGPLFINKEHFWRVIGKNDCGTFTSEVFSFTTTVSSSAEPMHQKEIDLFPNPAQEELTISSTTLFDKKVDVNIMDNLGRIVYAKKELSLPISIATNHFTDGIYYLQLVEKRSVIGLKKVVIQH